ncbi:MAG: hypothetical protein HY748_03835 [Elusimicrobia bacterium]|nr:hypothetical protein [Elusimicrobiota bacterium]
MRKARDSDRTRRPYAFLLAFASLALLSIPAAALKVTAGTFHTCALLDDGTVKCWGDNSYGQLGLGDTSNRGDGPGEMGASLPSVSLGAGRTASAIAAGTYHTCALLDNATVKCWGRNDYGQLGLGDNSTRGDGPGEMGDNLPPVSLGTGRTAAAIATGSEHTCALLDNGAVKCWGRNGVGQLGLGDTSSRGGGPGEMGDNLPPVSLGTGRTAMAIAAGYTHTCALLDNGAVKCWGYNGNGQLGLGDTSWRGDGPGEMGDSLPAVSLGTGRTALAIAAGGGHTCALLDNDAVKCWGQNEYGQLGLGDTSWRGDGPGEMGDNLPAVSLGAGRTASVVVAGAYHACALLDNGAVKCWGRNDGGELGLGDTSHRGDGPGEMGDSLPAVSLGTGRTAVAIAGGWYHTCALLDNGTVKCWGYNDYGQLGLGDTSRRGDGPGEMGDALPAVDLGGASSYSLTVTKAGVGAGSVTSSPLGIACGAICSADFNSGTVVTLTASPNSGYVFGGWSGEGCSGTGACVVTMDAARSVTATFGVVPRAGWGQGGYDLANTYWNPEPSAAAAAPATVGLIERWSFATTAQILTGDVDNDGFQEVLLFPTDVSTNTFRLLDRFGHELWMKNVTTELGLSSDPGFVAASLSDMEGDSGLEVMVGGANGTEAVSQLGQARAYSGAGTLLKSFDTGVDVWNVSGLRAFKEGGEPKLVAQYYDGFPSVSRGVQKWDYGSQTANWAYTFPLQGASLAVADFNSANPGADIAIGGFAPSNGMSANGYSDNTTYAAAISSDGANIWGDGKILVGPKGTSLVSAASLGVNSSTQIVSAVLDFMTATTTLRVDNGDGSFLRRVGIGAGWAVSHAVGDVTYDADLEVVMGFNDGKIIVYDMRDILYSFPFPGATDMWVALGDVTGDSRAEIVAAYGSTVTVFACSFPICGSLTGLWSRTFPDPVNGYLAISDIIPGGSNEILVGTKGRVHALSIDPAFPRTCATGRDVKKDGTHDYATIQAAVDALPRALPGDACVVVRDTETYSEQVTVEGFTNNGYQVRIMSDPSFISSAPVVSPPAASTGAFVVRNASVAIAGFTVRGTNAMPYGVLASSAYVIISSVNVDSAGKIGTAGIAISSWSAVSASSVTVQAADGLYLTGMRSVVSFSTATNASSAGHRALRLDDASSNTITHCLAANSDGPAAGLDRSGYNSISLSTISAVNGPGLSLWRASSNTVAGSYIQGSSAAVIAGSTGTVVDMCVLAAAQPGGDGLSLGGGSVNLSLSSAIVIGGAQGAGIRLEAGNAGVIDLSSIAVAGSKRGLEIGQQAGRVSVATMSFSGMAAAATAVRFLGGVVVSTLAHLSFDDQNIAVNVDGGLLAAGARISVCDGSGEKAGSLFEADPKDVVDWYVDCVSASRPTFALTVVKTGPGAVFSSPSGIVCGDSCTAEYSDGTVVALAAQRPVTAEFGGWQGAGCAGTGACVVVMRSPMAVVAAFNQAAGAVTNHPNPFGHRGTRFAYLLPQGADVTIKLFSLTGKLVRFLADPAKRAGYNETLWDGKDMDGHEVARGVYHYQFRVIRGASESVVTGACAKAE